MTLPPEKAGYPSDWPSNPLDLSVHDRPHSSSSTEWWYINSHLETVLGRRYSIFASFLRVKLDPQDRVDGREHAHSLIWGIIDKDQRRYLPSSYFEHVAPQIALKRLERGKGPRDPRMCRALREAVSRGEIPRPDRMLKRYPVVAQDRLFLQFDESSFSKRTDGTYHLELFDEETNAGCSLRLNPTKPFVLHGDEGVVRGSSGEDMFYYFTPRCDVTGAVTIEGETQDLKSGMGWYDHEFGRMAERGSERDIGWSWLSAQLDDGSELSLYDLFDRRDPDKNCGHWAVHIDRDGHCTRYREFTLTPRRYWHGYRTFTDFPVDWDAHIPALNLHIEVRATFSDQEFITANSEPSFWEGAVSVKGTKGGQPIAGPGIVECSGFDFTGDLDGFYRAVGKATRGVISDILPLQPDRAAIEFLTGAERRKHIAVGLEGDLLSQVLTAPLREVLDRGGKAWRSYALMLCVEIVGGDPNDFGTYLALPELLHTGSLIIDDVQDRSTVRRGGPTCHEVHGTPLAINAGCAAYFLAEATTDSIRKQVPIERQLEVYRLYFEAMRAGHAGQALDIRGLTQVVDQALAEGDVRGLRERVLTIHRLKSAIPARTAAEMGATLGGGEPELIVVLGDYAEAMGLAFQIVDDILNLRGFEGKLKDRGEDLREGKATFPVVAALEALPLEQARRLWSAIRNKPSQQYEIDALIHQIDTCGALDGSMDLARRMVNEAWLKLDPHFECSFAKIRLRAFGYYLLDRHY